MVELYANNGDPDQMLPSAVPDLCPHYLPITILGVSRLQRVKRPDIAAAYESLKYFVLPDENKAWHFKWGV